VPQKSPWETDPLAEPAIPSRIFYVRISDLVAKKSPCILFHAARKLSSEACPDIKACVDAFDTQSGAKSREIIIAAD
jgi:hypothetical protein